MSFVEFKNVKKTYRSGEINIEAVKGIDFEIEEGELVIIVGPSGAGKTTVLNLLGGMDVVTDGEILLDNELISKYNDTM